MATGEATRIAPRLPAAALARPFANRDFRLLFTSQLASEFGDWGARLALTVLIYDDTGSAGLAGLVLVVSFLPWGLLGPALSTLGDRYPRRTLMVLCDLIRGGLFLLLVLDLGTAPEIVVVFLASLAAPPYDAARSATLVEVFDDDPRGYGAASVVSSVTTDAGIVVGYAAGGFLLAVAGPTAALTINALTFISSAELTRRLGAGRTVPARPPAGSRVLAGARAIWLDPFLWRAAWLGIVTTGAAVAIQALLPIVAADEVGADGTGVGVLASVSAVATGLCGFLLPHAGNHRVLLGVQARIAAFGGLVAAPLFFVLDSWPLVLVPVFCSGLIFGGLVPAMPVVGLRLPQSIRSSSFGVLQGATLLFHAAAAAIGTWSADAVGARAVLVTASMTAGAIGLWGVVAPVKGRHLRVGDSVE